MAVSAATVWEIRSSATAGNANGGGYVTGATGTDWSQQDAAQYNLTLVTAAGAGNTVLTVSAAADMVGNIAHVVSGTNFNAGWYEILSVVAGVSITFGTNAAGQSASAGVALLGVINIGGAFSLATSGAASDDAVFENAQPGNIWWAKFGTYNLTAVNIAADGGTQKPIFVIGYNTTRGDNPVTDATRPTLNVGINSITFGVNWERQYLTFTGTNATATVNAASGGKDTFCKFINRSTTAGSNAIRVGNGGLLKNSEVICYRGNAVGITNIVNATVADNYIHDSDVGITDNNTTLNTFIYGNIISDNVTAAIKLTAAKTGNTVVYNNTCYGAENKLGIGFHASVSGATNIKLINNIFYGLSTGVSHADVQTVGYDSFNNYFNNTTDVTNWTKGADDIANNPTFVTMAQLTGSTATTSGSVLTQSGGNFSTVTDNVDFVYIKSGTGVTVGKYLITAHTTTTITLDIAPGTNATADKVWQITTGHNFRPTTTTTSFNFPGALTSTYLIPGAAKPATVTSPRKLINGVLTR